MLICVDLSHVSQQHLHGILKASDQGLLWTDMELSEHRGCMTEYVLKYHHWMAACLFCCVFSFNPPLHTLGTAIPFVTESQNHLKSSFGDVWSDCVNHRLDSLRARSSLFGCFGNISSSHSLLAILHPWCKPQALLRSLCSSFASSASDLGRSVVPFGRCDVRPWAEQLRQFRSQAPRLAPCRCLPGKSSQGSQVSS